MPQGRALFLRVLLLGSLAALRLPAMSAAEAPQLAAAEVALAEGLLELEAGRTEQAAERFAEAARLNPVDGTPRYWRGLALLQLGRAREAVAEIEASLETRWPLEVDPERVRADLAAARKATEEEGTPQTVEPPEWRPVPRAIDDRGLWEGNAGVSLSTDSNPNLLSQELSLPPPDGERGELVRGEEADEAALLNVRVGLYPLHAREGPSLGVTLDARQSLHQDFGFLDHGRVRGAVQLALGSDPLGYLTGPFGSARAPFGTSRFTALFQAGGTVHQLDGSSYLRAWQGAASLAFHETPATATRLDLAWADRDFAEEVLADERRSGEDLTLEASQLFFFGRRDRFIRLGLLTGDRRAEREFSASFRGAGAELRLPFGSRWIVSLEGSVREDDYDHPESNLFEPSQGEPREDTTLRVRAALVWELTDRLRGIARITHVDRDSSVDLGEGLPDLGYQRTIATAGLTWVFR